MQYFFPYKEDMDNDWEGVLEEFIPRLIDAGDALEYNLTIKELTTRINDTHAFTNSPYLNYYFGYYHAPIEVRYIQNQTIVTRVFPDLMDPPGAVQVGDIVVKCRNTDIDTFRNQIRKYIEASNEPTRERNIDRYVIRGGSEPLPFTLLRDGQTINVTVKGYYASVYWDAVEAADNLLDKWKILPDNIGYVHMGILQIEDVDQMMAELMDTQAIIFDVRNYPNGTNYSIANYLNPTAAGFAKATLPDLGYPGEFYFTNVVEIGPESNPDYYKGRVVMLIDERTQSHAEWTCMGLQTAPDTTIIGSQTAGADGNVSYFWLPGYIYTYFTGLGIYYPDGTPTQRIGIVPDIVIRPTIAGIQQGRDEVLERAVQFIQNN
jgi:C-terminal processing protease CtpA/Prc